LPYGAQTFAASKHPVHLIGSEYAGTLRLKNYVLTVCCNELFCKYIDISLRGTISNTNSIATIHVARGSTKWNMFKFSSALRGIAVGHCLLSHNQVMRDIRNLVRATRIVNL
jgi:hypothetical protein